MEQKKPNIIFCFHFQNFVAETENESPTKQALSILFCTSLAQIYKLVSYLCCLHYIFCRHAHYQAGNTPLALVWKDEKCSQYVIDTDSKGQIPSQQQVLRFLMPCISMLLFAYVI